MNVAYSSKVDLFIKIGLKLLDRKYRKREDFTNWLNDRLKASNITIKEPTLSRYLSDKISISKDRGLVLYQLIKKELSMESLILEKIKKDKDNDWSSVNTRILLTDIILMQYIALSLYFLWINEDFINKIDAVICAEADGIPFGVLLAQTLQCKCIYIRKNKRPTSTDHEEFVQIEVQRYRSVQNLYLSLSELPKNSNVIVVDDIKRSGTTIINLEELVKKGGSTVLKKQVIIDIPPKNENIIEKRIDTIVRIENQA